MVFPSSVSSVFPSSRFIPVLSFVYLYSLVWVACLDRFGNVLARKGMIRHVWARLVTNGYGLGNYLRGDYEGDTGGLGEIPKGVGVESHELGVKSWESKVMSLYRP